MGNSGHRNALLSYERGSDDLSSALGPVVCAAPKRVYIANARAERAIYGSHTYRAVNHER